MQYVLGIDIGPASTAAAVRTLHQNVWSDPVPVKLGARTAAVPSVLYLDDDGYLLTGDLARQAGAVNPERLITGIQQRIGDDVPVVVAGEPFTAESLSAVIAGWIVDEVTRDHDGPPRRITLTHPAGWGRYRRGLLDAALRKAELTDVALVPAPVAAVHGGSPARPAGGSVFGVCEPGHTMALVTTAATGTIGDATVLAHDDDTGTSNAVDALLDLAHLNGVDPRRLGAILLCGDPADFPATGSRPSHPVLVAADPRLTTAFGAARLASTPPANAVETTRLPRVTARREVTERPPRPPVDITPFAVPVKKPALRFLGRRPGLTKAAVIVFGVTGMLLAFEGHAAIGNAAEGSAAPQGSCSAPAIAGKAGHGC